MATGDWEEGSLNNCIATVESELGNHVLELNVSGGVNKRYHLLSKLIITRDAIVEFSGKLMNGKDNLQACVILRATDLTLNNCYSMELKPFWTGAAWTFYAELYKIADGIRSLLASTTPIVYGISLDWNRWRMRCYNLTEDYSRIVFCAEYFNILTDIWDTILKFEYITDFLFDFPGFVGFGAWALASDTDMLFRFNDLVLGRHYQ